MISLEEKIAKDHNTYGHDIELWFKWLFEYPETSYLLIAELYRCEKIIGNNVKFLSLIQMLKSKNLDDIELAKELIDQFRTKRLKHDRINRNSTEKT